MDATVAEAMLRPVMPGVSVVDVVPRAGGEVTRVFEVRLAAPDPPVIVKVYPDRFRWRLAKEVYVYQLLARAGITTVPRVLRAEAAGCRRCHGRSPC